MTQLYLTMPQPGETITEGTIVSWLVKPGDQISEAQPLAELETEKAVFEYESPFEGKLVRILHDAGKRVPVAEPIAVVDCDAAKAEMYKMMGIAKDAGTQTEVSIQQQKTVETTHKKEAPVVKSQQVVSKNEPTPTVSVALKLSPYVRKQALQNQLSDSQLQVLADAEGRVTKTALDEFLSGGVVSNLKSHVAASNVKTFTAPKPQEIASDAYRVEPCSAIRMRIADNMVQSKLKIPHAHNGIAVDVTRVVDFRETQKNVFKKSHGVNLNFLSLIYPVLVAALQKFPMINASYDDSTNPHQIKYFNHINLGVAVGSEHGLVIPVVKNIESLSFREFNQKLSELLDKAQTRKLKPDDLMGATLIFNNFGFFGTNLGVQVIQYPMAATLGMGTIEKRVVPVNDGTAIGIRTMSDLVLSFDHRVMDGRETGQFLKFLKEGIENLDFSHVK